MNRKTIEQVKKIDILKVADAMHLEYTQRGKYRWTLCFMHEDRNPSLWLKVGANTWFCPVCGKGGDNIALVMAHENLRFPDAAKWLAERFGIEVNGDGSDIPSRRADSRTVHIYRPTKTNKTTMTTDNTALTEAHQTHNFSLDSTFCRAILANNILTQDQLAHAAQRYHLGKSKDGGVIYWMIDSDQTVLDGKVMFYSPDCHRDHDRKPFFIASWLVLHKRLPEKFTASRCLFGLHLIEDGGTSCRDARPCVSPTSPCLSPTPPAIAIVESEKTAVICSEIFPDYTWLATGGMSNLTPAMLAPLKGRKIILFPDTDPEGSTYRRWKDIAIEAGKTLNTGIMVSSILERKASQAQKRAKIDIADYFLNPDSH